MKKYIFSIIIIFLFSVCTNNFVFAEENSNSTQKKPEVCIMPSATMQSYLAFQKEMIDLLAQGTLGQKIYHVNSDEMGPYSRKLITFNTGGSLIGLSGTVFQHILKSIGGETQKLFNMQVTTDTLVLIVIQSTIGSTFSLVNLLIQQEPIVRDWRALQIIDSEIFDTAYALSKKIKIVNTLEDISPVIEIFSRYSDILIAPNNNANVSYAGIFIALTKLNAKMKNFFANPVAREAGFYHQVDFGTSKIGFKEGVSDILLKEYDAAFFGFECDTSMSNMMQTLTGSVAKNLVGGWKDSTKMIKESTQKLKVALKGSFISSKKKDDQRFSDEEKELLRSIYGLDTSRMTEERGNRWRNHLRTPRDSEQKKKVKQEKEKRTKEQKKEDKEKKKDDKKEAKNIKKLEKAEAKREKIKEKAKIQQEAMEQVCEKWQEVTKKICVRREKGECKDEETITYYRCVKYFSLGSLEGYCTEENLSTPKCVQYNQNPQLQTLDEEWTTFQTDTLTFYHDSLTKMTELDKAQLQKIYTAIEFLDGDDGLKKYIGKKGEDNTLIQILGTLCEKQCSNKGNKGCWASKNYFQSDLVY